MCDNSLENFIDNNVNTQSDTGIVHIGRKSQNECAVMVNAGKRSFKALWDSGAGRCVISHECYNKISPKFKSDLFTSDIRLKAANGTFIRNKGECEISFKIGQETFRFLFLCLDQLSQELILGHNFAQTFHIGTLWNANDVMSLTRNGQPFADTLHTNDINALVFSTESIVIPPFSNAFIKCKMPKVKRQAHLGKTCVFEPSVRLKAVYTGCTTYEGIVTIDDNIFQSGIFNVVMTNASMKHVKINNNQTMGMLRTCQDDKICTIHRIVSFDKVPVKGEGDKTVEKQVGKDLYHIPIRNEKTGKIEINTLLKKGEYFPVINEIGPQQDFVKYKKPELQDASIDKGIKTALEKLLEANQDSFAEDER